MKILYVCHRFPFPPKRGGKIRPFNMIRHLSAVGTRSRWLARRVRTRKPRKGAASRRSAPRFDMSQVDEPVQGARMVARLPTAIPSSIGFFYSRDARRDDPPTCSREQRFDLIFVHCSSVAQYVAHVRDVPKILDFGDMDSQKWLEYARYKPFPLSLGYWLEGVKLDAEEKRLARRFDLCTATTRAEWETLDGYGTDTPTDWFPNGVDAEFFAPGDGTVSTPTRSASSGAWTTTRTRSA